MHVNNDCQSYVEIFNPRKGTRTLSAIMLVPAFRLKYLIPVRGRELLLWSALPLGLGFELKYLIPVRGREPVITTQISLLIVEIFNPRKGTRIPRHHVSVPCFVIPVEIFNPRK